MSRSDLQQQLDAVLAASSSSEAIKPFIPAPGPGRMILLGAGKAAAAMAQAFEQAYNGPIEGAVVTRDGHAVPCAQIQVIEAAHPMPDERCVKGAETLLSLAASAGPGDRVVMLLSGGASSLLACPPAGVSLAELAGLTKALLNGGATIGELNTLRRHLSRIAGGRLALACAPAQLTTLVISDVTGDVLHDIGSGPTCGDPSSVDDVRAMLARFDVPVSPALDAFLQTDAAETPVVVPGEIHLVATPQQALEAAADVARAQGYAVLNLGAFIEADAVETAKIMAGVARQIRAYGLPIRAPAVVLSGGECTVTVTGTGCGGRNAQFAMGLAAAIDGMDGVTALAVDTDGVDGAADIAGAWVDGSTATRAAAAGYPLADAIAANDGHGLFERLGEQVITGPTLTNVNDFRAILVN